MNKIEYHVVGMHCFSCSSGIQKLLKKNKAVANVEVDLPKSRLFVTYDETKIDNTMIVATVARLGYKAVPAE